MLPQLDTKFCTAFSTAWQSCSLSVRSQGGCQTGQDRAAQSQCHVAQCVDVGRIKF